MKKLSTFVLIMLLCSVWVAIGNIGIVKAEGTIYIRADGAIEGTNNITRDGNVYTFTDDIYASLVVERDNIVVDGAGYTLAFGMDDDFDAIIIEGKSNVIVKNLIITGSGSAIKFNQASNCVVVNNTIRVNETGLVLKNSEGINVLQNSIEALWGISLDDSLDNVISENTISKIVLWGIRFVNSSNNIFSQNNVVANETAAPTLTVIEIDNHSSGNTIENNIVTGTRNITEISTITGISIRYSSDNNILSNNTITCNNFGLYIQGCSGNQISSNKISNNELGISLAGSPNNMLRYNLLENNENHFRVQGNYLSQLINDIDASNTADGKSIYYLVNKHNITVSSDAGYVALVNCTGVTVENLDLSGNGQGVMMGFTTNCTIRNNDLSNNHDGVWGVSSSGNVISGNYITATEFGIAFINYGNNIDSANNVVANNIIDSNKRGIWLSRNNNTFVGNTFTNNVAAVWISGSSNNRFYLNNFVNNTDDVFDLSYGVPFLGSSSHNIWDNGQSEGNYWSNYNSTDTNNDGIADAGYVLYEDNIDNYPLMAPVTIFDAGLWEWTQYYVDVISNSSVSDFSFNPENALIRFNVDGETGTTGFCRVTIPKDLLNTEGNWGILVDGTSVAPIINDDINNSYIYFIYNHSTQTIEIIGTTAIPEFPSWIILPLFLVVTFVGILAKKRLFQNTI